MWELRSPYSGLHVEEDREGQGGVKVKAIGSQKSPNDVDSENPLSFLFSESDDSDVCLVHVRDAGSIRCYARGGDSQIG